jgi:hypothetical protein
MSAPDNHKPGGMSVRGAMLLGVGAMVALGPPSATPDS